MRLKSLASVFFFPHRFSIHQTATNPLVHRGMHIGQALFPWKSYLVFLEYVPKLFSLSLASFDFGRIAFATDDFSNNGEGGFGPLYRISSIISNMHILLFNG
jgi:hypothetical protein